MKSLRFSIELFVISMDSKIQRNANISRNENKSVFLLKVKVVCFVYFEVLFSLLFSTKFVGHS